MFVSYSSREMLNNNNENSLLKKKKNADCDQWYLHPVFSVLESDLYVYHEWDLLPLFEQTVQILIFDVL